MVQRPKPLPYGSQLKVTISRYYTPSGRCIQALDYRNRKKDGSAIRYDENQYTAFKTKNGRTVYDGGGIQPDVVIGKERPNKFIERLLKSSLVFDFSNQYFYNNSVNDVEGFSLDKKDFERFKEMSLDKKYDALSESQASVDQLKNTLEEEGFGEMRRGFEDLESSLRASKMEMIESSKSEIVAVLEGEIIKRYFYREGMYSYFLTTNNEVYRAQEIINDQEVYNSILK